MARNYSQATIKTLFGEASSCAYPGCREPLIFRDRGKATAIAEIAHIRSETPGGPRHDPDYLGDINGPENLLLLCGKHHRPVDRHESIYSIEELEGWKLAQRASAGAGTPLTDADIRSYQRLSDEERQSLTELARLATRVTGVCRSVQRGVNDLRAEAEALRRSRASSYPTMWQVDDQGNRSPVDHSKTPLSRVEQQGWRDKEEALWAAAYPRAQEALGKLEEEVAVLRMFDPALASAGTEVIVAAEDLIRLVGNSAGVTSGATELDASLARLWRLANGGIAAT